MPFAFRTPRAETLSMDLLDLVLAFLAGNDAEFYEKVVLGVVVYFVARREVRKQFTGLNGQLSKIESALKSFGEEIVALEAKHDKRITRLEDSVEGIQAAIRQKN